MKKVKIIYGPCIPVIDSITKTKTYVYVFNNQGEDVAVHFKWQLIILNNSKLHNIYKA